MQLRLRRMVIASLLAAAFLGIALWRLADHDLAHREHEGFTFQSGGATIAGSLWLPEGDPIAAVALVHGDGPQDRTSAGGYAPLINSLLNRQIAVASWDKPGVGSSEGAWLLQTMADRTVEAQTALQLLDRRFGDRPIGALGFSQAGWVLPSLTPDDADFVILVGAAVSWQEQGDYYTRVRLSLEGLPSAEIDEAVERQTLEDERIFGPDAQADEVPDGMSMDRWNFIRQNRNADARDALSALDLPVLAIWGENDLNVDAARNAATYREILAGADPRTEIIVVPNATHGLLRAPAYNWQLVADWSALAKLTFLAEGRYAFAPGALDTIADWIEQYNQ